MNIHHCVNYQTTNEMFSNRFHDAMEGKAITGTSTLVVNVVHVCILFQHLQIWSEAVSAEAMTKVTNMNIHSLHDVCTNN